MRRILSIAFLSFMFFAHLLVAEKSYANNNPRVSEIILQAEKLRSQASKLGFEWTTTGELINKANKALKDGDNNKAKQLANRAIKEAQSAIKQAQYAQKNWHKSVL